MRSPRTPKRLIYAAVCIFLFAAAALIRIRAAFNDLWIDEIWSIELVRELHSALGVFTQSHHDNNHYLNSLFIYFFGQRGNWPGYRIPAEVFGIGAIVLAWLIGACHGKMTAFFSVLLVGFSYVLILYSSEARGYAPLIFFCFGCFLILHSFLEKPRWQLAALFSLAALLGLISHLTFLIFLAASLPWFCLRLLRLRLPIASVATWTLACYCVPLAGLFALYIVDLRFLQIGGGTPITIWDGYRAMLAWTLGGPNTARLQPFSIFVCAAGFAAGIWLLIRERTSDWIFYLGAIVAAPLAMALIDRGTLHYVRYFIVPLGFLLLLFGRLLGSLFEKGYGGKIFVTVCCLAFIALNAWNIAALFKFGRGHTSEAVQYMDQNTSPAEEISFGGEQDFRIQFILGFYWRKMMGDKPANYYDHDHWPETGPEWVIFHKDSFTEPISPGSNFYDKFGNWYELTRTFPTAPLSGVHLFLYRKLAAPAQ